MSQQAGRSFWDVISNLHMFSMRWTDVIEILIIAVFIYGIMLWFRNTRAWMLFRGLLIIGIFVVIAEIFNMTTILWIVRNVTGVAVIALVILLQPELRGALDELGQRNFLRSILPADFFSGRGSRERFSDRTINELVRACTVMAKAKTGALIVIELDMPLRQYERTGISIDGIVTSQLLINIFEKNTPLHDGAVIVRGDRVTSATCYLPLSANTTLDKNLGTRHRAGVGISEVTDSFTIIVSEETGEISIARKGKLTHGVDEQTLRNSLLQIQNKAEAAGSDEKRLLFRHQEEDTHAEE